MILDNSGIDHSRMLLFVLGFLVYWKIEPNSRASGNTWFTIWLQTGHVKVVRKTKYDVKDNNFLCFITINNISTPFFNWKIAAIHFVCVIDYYYVLLFNKIEWKILLPIILALKFFYTSNYLLLAHRRSMAVLCMLYKISCNPLHPLYGAIPVLYFRFGLHAALWSSFDRT